jgi:ubiquinone/menaquinone biosynthesis C-methylase UbiE
MRICPSCGGEVGPPFYELFAVPTNSCLLIDSRDAALAFPTAPIHLCCCEDCGFIFNAAWEASRTVYSHAYEETQGFSSNFNTFHERLARQLISRHNLRGKRVIEIGCGKGDFLAMLCSLGDNAGIGYDPSFVPSRLGALAAGQVRFVQEFFDSTTQVDRCDALCCKMTLEHIPDVRRFLADIRRCLEGQPDTLVFFQVPNMGRILAEGAFWDIYYEHCSYFAAASLFNLFERSGFAVSRIWTDYDNQYLMIEASPSREPTTAVIGSGGCQELKQLVGEFARMVEGSRAAWLSRMRSAETSGKRTALWGAGSKAVAFLTSLGLKGEVSCAVDVNPFKRGYFLPATGHMIIGPDDVPAFSPNIVVVMNPIYQAEVLSALRMRGCYPELLTV